MAHTENGRDLLQRFVQVMNSSAVTDGAPKMEGRSLSVLLMPARKKSKASPVSA